MVTSVSFSVGKWGLTTPAEQVSAWSSQRVMGEAIGGGGGHAARRPGGLCGWELRMVSLEFSNTRRSGGMPASGPLPAQNLVPVCVQFRDVEAPLSGPPSQVLRRPT